MSASGTAPDLLSVVIPARDEAGAIVDVLQAIKRALLLVPCPSEIILVDDGSRDGTAERASAVEGVVVLRNPASLGYGHSLLRGIAVARGELIAIIDADGTYPADALPTLYAAIEKGSDQAIGQRTGPSFERLLSARRVYRFLCHYVAGHGVPDANSGLRIFRRSLVESLRVDLCLGFSFTTSLTLASLLTGYVVTFTPVAYSGRIGTSHVRYRDVLRTMQYLFQLVAVYNPLKLFLPLVIASGAAAASCLAGGAAVRSGPALVCGALLVAATLLLIGIAAATYVISRVGQHPAPLRKRP